MKSNIQWNKTENNPKDAVNCPKCPKSKTWTLIGWFKNGTDKRFHLVESFYGWFVRFVSLRSYVTRKSNLMKNGQFFVCNWIYFLSWLWLKYLSKKFPCLTLKWNWKCSIPTSFTMSIFDVNILQILKS